MDSPHTLAVHRHGPELDRGSVPLVLLHPFPLDSTMWEPVLAHLDMTVLAVDLPGFGDSPTGFELARRHDQPVAPQTSAAAREVLLALDGAGVDTAVIVGISMGGYVAMAIAQDAPHRVAGIALLDTKAEGDDAQARSTRLRIADAADGSAGARAVAPMIDTMVGSTTHGTRPEVVEDVRRRLAAARPEGIAHAQRAMAERPARLAALEALGERGVPALVLRGSEDVLSQAESAEAMARALHTEVVTIEGAGHLTPLETPREVADALAELHRRVTAG